MRSSRPARRFARHRNLTAPAIAIDSAIHDHTSRSTIHRAGAVLPANLPDLGQGGPNQGWAGHMMAGTIRGDVMVAAKSPRGTKSRSRRRVTAIPDNLGKASDDRITKEGVAERSIRKTIATLISPLRPRTKLGRQTQHRGELIRKLAEAERAYRQFQFDTAMANSSDRPTRMTADEYRDAVLEFEELEYDLAAAINEFVYYV